MVFSRQHIHNIAKKNFIIDFELLSILGITKTEAIILDHISYFNKAYGAISLNISQFVEILQISRQHFYRCIKKLIDKKLIFKDSKGIEVTELYKETKFTCFKKAHNNKSKQADKYDKNAKTDDFNKHEKMLDNLSHNVTKVSHNVTLPILYNTKNNSMCVSNTHRVDIENCFRHFNKHNKLLDLLCLLKWRETEKAERVFKPTHKARFFNRKAKKVA